jgi:hypothetical protein
MQVRVDDQVGILDTVILPMRCPAHTGTWTGFFLPDAAKSTLTIETAGHWQAQSRQSLFHLIA